MKEKPTFRLVPLEELLAHEEIDEGGVHHLAEDIQGRRVVEDPIWVAVAEDSYVILNGHHRVAALRKLGATHAPAWVIDYPSSSVRLERWSDGPPIGKDEVVRRAKAGELFPPKTTRHVMKQELPSRPTPLEELEGPEAGPRRPRTQRRTSARSRSTGADAPGSG